MRGLGGTLGLQWIWTSLIPLIPLSYITDQLGLHILGSYIQRMLYVAASLRSVCYCYMSSIEIIFSGLPRLSYSLYHGVQNWLPPPLVL